MAQTNYTPIQLYYSTTAAAVPVNTNLANGELAINITDGKLYYKDNGGTVRLLASNATSAPVLSFSAGTTGFTPNTATSGAITLAGTLATTNGGTGLTSFTSGGVVYASSTSALATSPNLFFDSSNARLGILTTSPQSDIHIARLGGGQSATMRLQGNQGSDAQVGVLDFSNRTDITGGYIIGSIAVNRSGDDNSGAMLFSTALGASTPSERLRITSAGNVGIGTSSPAYKLQVAGTVGVSGIITSTQTAGQVLAAGSGGTAILYSNFSNTGGTFLHGVDNSTGDALYSGGVAYAGFVATTGATPIILSTNGAARVTVSSAGNVGIGTSSPVSLLETQGSSAGKIGITVTNNREPAGPAFIAFKGYDWTRAAIWHDRSSGLPLQIAINPNTTDLTINGCVVRASFNDAGDFLVGSTTVAGTNAPTAKVVVGRLRSFAGSTSTIANGATVDIALTLPGAIVSYIVQSDGNSNNMSAGLFRSNTDGASSSYTLFSQSEANVAVTAPSGGIIRITNNIGSSSAFYYSFTVLSGL
jgi:hypothetical protein